MAEIIITVFDGYYSWAMVINGKEFVFFFFKKPVVIKEKNRLILIVVQNSGRIV